MRHSDAVANTANNRQPRIVSLLPGATDLIVALGLERQLVGISAHCNLPEHMAPLPRVNMGLIPASTVEPAAIDAEVRRRISHGEPLFHADADQLKALKPDLILSQSLCDVCATTPSALTAEAIANARVLSLDGRDLDGLINDIHAVITITGMHERGAALIEDLNARRARSTAPASAPRRRVVAIEWPEPIFIGGHWIPDMLITAGGETLGAPGDHSVVVDWQRIQAFDPQVLLIMPCGEHLDGAERGLECLRRQPDFLNLAAVAEGEVYLLDGDRYFSRPGPNAFTGLEIIGHILGTVQQDPAPGYWRAAERRELIGE